MLQMPQVTGSKNELDSLQLLQGNLPLKQHTGPQGLEASPGDREGTDGQSGAKRSTSGFLGAA